MIDPHEPYRIYVVDDDRDLGAAVARLLRRHGYAAEPFMDAALLTNVYSQAPADCIVTDIMMGDMDGFGLADALRLQDPATAIVFMTAWPTTANAVDAVRRYGGLDYLEKPIDEERLLNAIAEGCEWSRQRRRAMLITARLTPRERDVLGLLVKGKSNKMIAADLGLSPKTIEDHRAAIISKTGAGSIAQLMEMTKAGL